MSSSIWRGLVLQFKKKGENVSSFEKLQKRLWCKIKPLYSVKKHCFSPSSNLTWANLSNVSNVFPAFCCMVINGYRHAHVNASSNRFVSSVTCVISDCRRPPSLFCKLGRDWLAQWLGVGKRFWEGKFKRGGGIWFLKSDWTPPTVLLALLRWPGNVGFVINSDVLLAFKQPLDRYKSVYTA